MNRKLYRKIAKKHGVSAAEIKADMQTAINAAYENPDCNLINLKVQNAVSRKGDISTTDIFVRHAADEVRRWEKEK